MVRTGCRYQAIASMHFTPVAAAPSICSRMAIHRGATTARVTWPAVTAERKNGTAASRNSPSASYTSAWWTSPWGAWWPPAVMTVLLAVPVLADLSSVRRCRGSVDRSAQARPDQAAARTGSASPAQADAGQPAPADEFDDVAQVLGHAVQDERSVPGAAPRVAGQQGQRAQVPEPQLGAVQVDLLALAAARRHRRHRRRRRE